MARTSVREILESSFVKLEPKEKNRKISENWFGVDAAMVPPDIIELIKNAPMRDVVPITDTVNFGEPILRCKSLVFNPKGQLNWTFPDVSSNGNFIAIAASRLVLNFPNQIADISKLKLTPPLRTQDLHGSDGKTSPSGWTSGSDDGGSGGIGSPGETGKNGLTYNYPNIYIFYNEIVFNNPAPNIVTALRIEGTGIQGGNGGKGGTGGRGGAGSRGTPGDRDCVLGICVCSAGPGRGGNGGPGGPGGKGGDAGRGGAGATIFFVGPTAQLPNIDRIEMSLNGSAPGTPGTPGSPGGGGQEGGGGSKPFECKDGGGSGQPGGAAHPPNLGSGATKGKGLDGAVFTANRNNTDLFT